MNEKQRFLKFLAAVGFSTAAYCVKEGWNEVAALAYIGGMLSLVMI